MAGEGGPGARLQQGWQLCSSTFLLFFFFFATPEILFFYLLISLFWSDLLKRLKSASVAGGVWVLFKFVEEKGWNDIQSGHFKVYLQRWGSVM